jgi:RNA polymerase-associated protein LEO1
MPNYVTVDSSPFHPDSYVGPEGEDVLRAESLRERGSIINLKVQNTVRWRWVKDENGVEVCAFLVYQKKERSVDMSML